MSDLSNLIERVSAATGPDREIDGLVCKLADPTEWQRCRRRAAEPSGAPEAAVEREAPFYAKYYTSSLDAVVSLVERELPGWDWDVGFHHAGPFAYANLEPGGTLAPAVGIFSGEAKTPAIALLLAFLRAKHTPRAGG